VADIHLLFSFLLAVKSEEKNANKMEEKLKIETGRGDQGEGLLLLSLCAKYF
jgi:hypothetical protein